MRKLLDSLVEEPVKRLLDDFFCKKFYWSQFQERQNSGDLDNLFLSSEEFAFIEVDGTAFE